ncbi:MAG TPA: hypothetical protein VF071_01250 [Candidatus Limnocylindria bacterium]
MTAPNTTTSSNSRRALLAGAVGGLGAWAASAVGRASHLRAANGDPILAGQTNSATLQTRLESGSSIALWAESTSSGGVGLYGNSVAGSTTGTGVYGNGSGWGVIGHGKVAGVAGQSTGGVGVRGNALGTGDVRGVHGNSYYGVGLFGTSTEGYALRAEGRTKLSTSGVATIPAGSTSVTVTPNVNVTNGSFVLLTPRANIGSRGLWYTVQASADTFRIRMSKSRSKNTKVAWLLLG